VFSRRLQYFSNACPLTVPLIHEREALFVADGDADAAGGAAGVVDGDWMVRMQGADPFLLGVAR
jgi:hypothetical protein